MKERPILFSAPMARALLDGTKTQTRRVVKPRRDIALGCDLAPHEIAGEINAGSYLNSPYGQPGDRLWVRESFRFPAGLDNHSPTAVADKCLDAGYSTLWCPTQFEADGGRTSEIDWRGFETPPSVALPGKLRPAIHMPRWASRILLEITDVRIERLNEISEEDAVAEGINRIPHGRDGDFYHVTNSQPDPHNFCYASDAFRALWEEINGANSWDANPWVWVIQFARVEAE